MEDVGRKMVFREKTVLDVKTDGRGIKRLDVGRLE